MSASPGPAPHSRPAMLVATFGGIGLLPGAPGTWGSLIALPLAFALMALGGRALLLAAAVALFAAGCWAAGRYASATGVHDPGSVVVDEVAGQWLTLLGGGLAMGWRGFLMGFVLFRLFDIVKPWPVSLADRRVPGGFGVMLDDGLAAIYAGIALHLLLPLIARL